MESVYIDTSVVSYLVARPSREPVTAWRQHLTSNWCNDLPQPGLLPKEKEPRAPRLWQNQRQDRPDGLSKKTAA